MFIIMPPGSILILPNLLFVKIAALRKIIIILLYHSNIQRFVISDDLKI